jgi:hypothetical protein
MPAWMQRSRQLTQPTNESIVEFITANEQNDESTICPSNQATKQPMSQPTTNE